VVWSAEAEFGDGKYLAVFNLTESREVERYEWKELGLTGKAYTLRDLWEHKDLGAAGALTVTLPPHGSILYRVSPVMSYKR
jgi:alpha-galactosidase